MKIALHETISLANSPCVGVCSTSMAPFDEICRGCGRNIDEIREWESYSEFEKKKINVANWLKGYNIRQRREIKELMKPEGKIKDITGRITTAKALIEMIGQDMMDHFGKDESIKSSYQNLVECHNLLKKASDDLPIDRQS